VREQLRAETDAQDRLVLCERLADHFDFRLQVRARIAVLDVHRTAEHDQPAIAIELGARIGLALEVDELHAMSALADQLVQCAERLGGDMLEDEDARHARSLAVAHAGMTTGRERPVASRTA